ncbi:C-type lectin-like 11 [Homarus americanus]|uniref:C-type lectin-like 11 n=2 Tax=Homarus americanus TaxID=6706 RepID=A0A8J5ND60_HOMAM|nr:C-type lectin-like 11 [Homarus americanus]
MRVLLLAALMAVVVVADVAGNYLQDNSNTQEFFTPIKENCTQSLTELLLLRQEVRLNHLVDIEKQSGATLLSLAQTLVEVRDALLSKQDAEAAQKTQCTSPFTLVGKNCLLLPIAERLNWAAGRQYCAARGADLATFSDANTFAEYLGFINQVNVANAAVGVWLGGTDEEVEEVWTWITGEPMPRGPPFWGTTDSYKPEPGNGRAGNCVILWHPDKYYMHDVGCTYSTATPLCQKILQ